MHAEARSVIGEAWLRTSVDANQDKVEKKNMAAGSTTLSYESIRDIVSSSIDRSALNQLFYEARTYNEWSEKPVDEQTVRDLYDLLKWGPTSANSSPARFVWLRSAGGKGQASGPCDGRKSTQNPGGPR